MKRKLKRIMSVLCIIFVMTSYTAFSYEDAYAITGVEEGVAALSLTCPEVAALVLVVMGCVVVYKYRNEIGSALETAFNDAMVAANISTTAINNWWSKAKEGVIDTTSSCWSVIKNTARDWIGENAATYDIVSNSTYDTDQEAGVYYQFMSDINGYTLSAMCANEDYLPFVAVTYKGTTEYSDGYSTSYVVATAYSADEGFATFSLLSNKLKSNGSYWNYLYKCTAHRDGIQWINLSDNTNFINTAFAFETEDEALQYCIDVIGGSAELADCWQIDNYGDYDKVTARAIDNEDGIDFTQLMTADLTYDDVIDGLNEGTLTIDDVDTAVGAQTIAIDIDDTDTDTVADAVILAGDDAIDLSITDAQDVADSETDEAIATAVADEETENEYTFDLVAFFPFCIPFDIYNMINALCADPEAPVINWEFQVLGQTHTLNIDLSAFDTVAAILRSMEVILFCVGLAFATNKLIKH